MQPRTPDVARERRAAASTVLVALLVVIALLGAAVIAWSARAADVRDGTDAASRELDPRATGESEATRALEQPDAADAGLRDVATVPVVATGGDASARSGLRVLVIVLEQLAIPSGANAAPPVVGVEVELVYAEPGEEVLARALERARTDVEGRARFELTPERVATLRAASGTARFGARIHERGWQSNTAADETGVRASSLELMILAQGGGTIVGRVRDARGEPVVAQVVARANGLAGPQVATRSSRRDGSYALHLRAEGPYDVRASMEQRGTVRVADHAVRFTDPPQVLDLQLVGPGRVRGRVLDSAGRAAAGVELRLARPTAPGMPPNPRRVDGSEEGFGLCEARTATDVDGRFDLTGLRDDVFVLHALVGGETIALTPDPVAADGRELEFVVDRPRLVVRLVDRTGEAWKGERTVSMAEAWPRVPRVSVVAASDDATIGFGGRVVDDGSCVFDGLSRGAYDVVLTGGDLAPTRTRVQIDERSGRVDVELAAVPNPIGRLVVTVNELAGEPSDAAFSVQLEDVETGDVVLVGALARDHAQIWPPGFDAPSGTWRLVVEGRADHAHMAVVLERGHGRVERVVRVLPGVETRVDVPMPLGGRVRVTLRGNAKPVEDAQRAASSRPDRIRLPDGSWWTTSLGDASTGRDLDAQVSGDATFELRDGSRTVADVQFAREPDALPHLVPSGLRYGATRTSQALPAGSYTLVARTHDGRVVEQRVLLVDGVTTDVVIEF